MLTILSPVAPELKPAQAWLPEPFEPPTPYERQVTLTLVEALSALEEAARQGAAHGGMEPFTAAVSVGVSANLCDAIVGLATAGAVESLDVQVSWSWTRPVERDVPARVQLGIDSIPIIEEAGRRFRETTPLEDFEVEGFVTRLAREPRATEGDVTINGIVDGQLRRIVVRLSVEAYSQAVRAHEGRLIVKCTGDLIKEGGGYRLRDPRHFHVLAHDDAA